MAGKKPEVNLFPNTRESLRQILLRGFPIAESEAEARATQNVIDLCKKIVHDWGNFDAVEEYGSWKARRKSVGGHSGKNRV